MLSAVAYDRSGREIGRDSLTSAGSGLRLHVEPETTTLVADGSDLAYLPITLTDDAGILRPLADRHVTVQVTGPAALLGLGSAQPITEEAFSTTQHSTYYGRALAVLRSSHQPGKITVAVTAEGCEPATVTLTVLAP